MTRTCPDCGHTATAWSSPDFSRWSKICAGCEASYAAMAAAKKAKRPVGVRTTSREDRILSLRNDLHATADQIANQLNMSLPHVRTVLSGLRRKGLEVRAEEECGGPLKLATPAPEPSRRRATLHTTGRHRAASAEVLA